MRTRSARWPWLLSSVAAVGTLAGGAPAAQAGCSGTAPAFECSGSGNPAQSVAADNASVATLPGFSVSETNKTALSISGKGQVSYTDGNASSLSSASKSALSVVSKGNDGVTPGGIDIGTNGSLIGATGIDATNNGTGALSVDALGTVEGTSGNAIQALNRNANAGALSIVTKETVAAKGTGISATNYGSGPLTIDTGSGVSGETGINAMNRGSGALAVDAHGTVTGTKANGISATNYGTDLSIDAADDVSGGTTGIKATNYGIGSTRIETEGAVDGQGTHGIQAVNENANSTSLTIVGKGPVTAKKTGITAVNHGTGPLTVQTMGSVLGGAGISAVNAGAGALSIDTGGTVTGTNANGITATNYGTDLSVAAKDAVTGGRNGIAATNYGAGKLTIDAGGDVTGTSGSGIRASNTAGTDLSISTAAGTAVNGRTGISANNAGSGTLTLDIGGSVEGTAANGISATNSGTMSTITARSGSSVRGATTGLKAVHNGTGPLNLDIAGAVEGLNGYGVYANTSGPDAVTLNSTGRISGTTDGVYVRHGGGPINLNFGQGSVVTSTGTKSGDFAIETSGGPTNLVVGGTLNGGAGGAAKFDRSASNAFNDRMELHPTAAVNGKVLAGPGTDTLAFGGEGHGKFDLDDIDTGDRTKQFQEFEIFQVDSGTWSFSGATPYAFTLNGGTLKGSGTFGELISNGGTISLGNSIGAMTINGDFTLRRGTVYEVEVNAAGENDRAIVNGTVNLTGATLRVLAQKGSYKTRTNYTIIENDGSDAVVGKFGSIVTNYAFLTPTVVYDGGDGNDVELTLLRTVVPITSSGSGSGGGSGSGSGGGTGGTGGTSGVTYLSFCSVADTRNQCGVAEALDPLPTDNPLFLSVLTQTEEGARQAFDSLSGEVHATVASTLVDDSRYARNAVLGRLMQASHRGSALAASGPQVASQAAGYDSGAMLLGDASLYQDGPLADPASQPLAFWTQAFGAWGDFSGNKNAASADRDLGGFISGMDASVGDTWRVGVATGASFSDVSVKDRYSSANVSTYHLGGYAGGKVEGFALRGGGLWAWSEIETSRAVVFPNFYERQTANYDATTGQLFGEVAYPTEAGGIELEPFAGLAFVSLDTDRFKERGGPQASLRGANPDQDVGYTTVGLRLAKTMMWGNMQVTPHIEAAWLHAFNDVTPGANLAFAATGTGFSVTGVPLAEDSALLDAGLDFALSDRLSAGVSYSGQYADEITDNAVKGRMTWLF
ncbi:autotransporter domain-containing protein [Methyloceanibacter sp.]|uniref:autotransporter domain-containing protein n=1 Tax=Methyloceanibacter sp. TaxID=1965321 RepID=UPI002C7E1F09|nr:autotransporter domain-containing protein [Methyloceanibacter sp.]HML92602.1 autotransporter domain-containing protein [Methyloceanibacter sp.]